MHDDIKRFQTTGFTDNNAQTKEWMVAEIERQMRDEGFVPSIDNEPQYTTFYLAEKELFEFILSVYGVEVGKDRSWDVSGMTSGKMIMSHTLRAKSKES